MKHPEAIRHFRGLYYFLRNEAPATVMHEGLVFPTLMHAFIAAKLTDTRIREEIARTTTVEEATKIAEANRDLWSKGWNLRSTDILADLFLDKFSREPFSTKLLATGRRPLVYGNQNGDRFWGVCGGKGYNVLGQMLMAVRDRLRDHAQRTEVKPTQPPFSPTDVEVG